MLIKPLAKAMDQPKLDKWIKLVAFILFVVGFALDMLAS
jgi:hypothetical protein